MFVIRLLHTEGCHVYHEAFDEIEKNLEGKVLYIQMWMSCKMKLHKKK